MVLPPWNTSTQQKPAVALSCTDKANNKCCMYSSHKGQVNSKQNTPRIEFFLSFGNQNQGTFVPMTAGFSATTPKGLYPSTPVVSLSIHSEATDESCITTAAVLETVGAVKLHCSLAPVNLEAAAKPALKRWVVRSL